MRSLLFFVLISIASAAHAQDATYPYEKIEDKAKCTGPTESPVCVTRTWLACHFHDGRICNRIGFKRSGVRPSKMSDILGRMSDQELYAQLAASIKAKRSLVVKEPWTFSIEELGGPEGAEDSWSWFNGIRAVDEARFGGSAVPRKLQGTLEVLMSSFVSHSAYNYSLFVKQIKNGEWRAVAWHGATSYAEAPSGAFGEEMYPAQDPWSELCPKFSESCADFIYGIEPWERALLQTRAH